MDGKKKKGQTRFVGLMIAIVLFLLALALAFPLNQVTTGDDVMGENGLNCSSDNLTNQQHAICTQTDSMQFLWFFVLIGLAGVTLWRTVA